MSLPFLLLALAGLVAIGIGASYLRGTQRPRLIGSFSAKLQQWFASLQGPRAIGAALVAAGALAAVLALVLRP